MMNRETVMKELKILEESLVDNSKTKKTIKNMIKLFDGSPNVCHDLLVIRNLIDRLVDELPLTSLDLEKEEWGLYGTTPYGLSMYICSRYHSLYKFVDRYGSVEYKDDDRVIIDGDRFDSMSLVIANDIYSEDKPIDIHNYFIVKDKPIFKVQNFKSKRCEDNKGYDIVYIHEYDDRCGFIHNVKRAFEITDNGTAYREIDSADFEDILEYCKYMDVDGVQYYDFID